MRKHDKGCTEKCRVKHSYLELDLDRNQALTKQLTTFNWCDACAGSQSSLSPPSGSKGVVPCMSACGLRLLSQCRPLMEVYGEQEARISKLKTRYEQLEERDVTFE